jgi:hypothetical protein
VDWIYVIGGILLARYLIKKYPGGLFPSGTGTVRTVRSVRKAYKNNIRMINRLPLSEEERNAAREAAHQKMLRDLDDLMT